MICRVPPVTLAGEREVRAATLADNTTRTKPVNRKCIRRLTKAMAKHRLRKSLRRRNRAVGGGVLGALAVTGAWSFATNADPAVADAPQLNALNSPEPAVEPVLAAPQAFTPLLPAPARTAAVQPVSFSLPTIRGIFERIDDRRDWDDNRRDDDRNRDWGRDHDRRDNDRHDNDRDRRDWDRHDRNDRDRDWGRDWGHNASWGRDNDRNDRDHHGDRDRNHHGDNRGNDHHGDNLGHGDHNNRGDHGNDHHGDSHHGGSNHHGSRSA